MRVSYHEKKKGGSCFARHLPSLCKRDYHLHSVQNAREHKNSRATASASSACKNPVP
jgi:hypothetical protein